MVLVVCWNNRWCWVVSLSRWSNNRLFICNCRLGILQLVFALQLITDHKHLWWPLFSGVCFEPSLPDYLFALVNTNAALFSGLLIFFTQLPTTSTPLLDRLSLCHVCFGLRLRPSLALRHIPIPCLSGLHLLLSLPGPCHQYQPLPDPDTGSACRWHHRLWFWPWNAWLSKFNETVWNVFECRVVH